MLLRRYVKQVLGVKFTTKEDHMECVGKMFHNYGEDCLTCKEYQRCYTLSKAKEEKKLFSTMEKDREENRYLKILRKKGYAV